MLTGPSPASLPLGTLSPEGRGDAWGEHGAHLGDASAPSSPRPSGERVPEGRVRGRKLALKDVVKARKLRRNETDAERRLWNLLRNRSVAGLKFVRQYPIGPCVADFVCRDRMLVIEVDGSQHADSIADERRTAFLNTRGYSVLRFWNNEVLAELDGVHALLTALTSGSWTGPSPDWRFAPATLSPEGRGDAVAPSEHKLKDR